MQSPKRVRRKKKSNGVHMSPFLSGALKHTEGQRACCLAHCRHGNEDARVPLVERERVCI